MIFTAVAARFSVTRTGAVLGRNFLAMRGTALFWIFLFSGVVEPLLYLLSIGVGVGGLIGTCVTFGAACYTYPHFVAPAMLAVAAMTGAVAASTFGFFTKLRYSKLFEAMFMTTVRPFEIAVAELVWATVRGLLFSAAFLVVMVSMGLTSVLGAVLALPVTALVSLAFGALGMVVGTLLRGWQDFDMVTAAQIALLLFSGTFTPVDGYPAVFRVLVELTPLYQAVDLIRGITLGDYRPAILWHAGYLLVMLAAGLFFAHRRLGKVFRQ